VHVRLRKRDAAAAAAIREQTEKKGGLAVVLDTPSGSVLMAAPFPDIRGVTITRHDVQKPAAEAVVRAFVTSAIRR
jgi:hypothetical protein